MVLPGFVMEREQRNFEDRRQWSLLFADLYAAKQLLVLLYCLVFSQNPRRPVDFGGKNHDHRETGWSEIYRYLIYRKKVLTFVMECLKTRIVVLKARGIQIKTEKLGWFSVQCRTMVTKTVLWTPHLAPETQLKTRWRLYFIGWNCNYFYYLILKRTKVKVKFIHAPICFSFKTI